MAVIINSATEQTQTLMDAVNRNLLPYVENEMVQLPSNLSLIPFGSCRNPLFEEELQNSVYVSETAEGMCGIAQLAGGAGLFGFDPEKKITELSFGFSDDVIQIIFTENGIRNVLPCARDRSFICTEIDGITYAAAGGWRSLRRLEAEIRRRDAISGVRLLFTFRDDQLSIEADETLMTDSGLGMTDRRLPVFIRMPVIK